ncbi:EpsD family peptidyl-prolyl cis-trans isomerase [Phenylobacterium sp.]|uniref:EpsD family peptidyl-prolyl cis-trans isomerase n=1 Tax=Phenylobacterium sp. TaxID=1871053 RepID=UPI002600C835|nr:EpsD family peptidyl-prolyl cis-trans isomerase [Phenylobacterium sp.]
MKTKGVTLVAVAVVASMTLAGCDKVKGLLGRKPSGQVVATVSGEEITTLELRNQLGGFSSRDAETMKRARQAALNRLILQDVVAQEAKKQKLDKSVDYNLRVEDGKKRVLAQLFERKIAQSVQTPSRTDAENFVAAHPEMFANRQVMVVDQVIAQPKKFEPEKYRPLKSLDEVKAMLNTDGAAYQESVSTIDTVSTDPRMTQQITKLPPGEVFVVPQRGGLVFNQVRDARTLPIRGDVAVSMATSMLQQQRTREAVAKQIEGLRKAAEGSIVYADSFKDLKPTDAKADAAKAPAAPTTPAAPAAAAPVTKAP